MNLREQNYIADENFVEISTNNYANPIKIEIDKFGFKNYNPLLPGQSSTKYTTVGILLGYFGSTSGATLGGSKKYKSRKVYKSRVRSRVHRSKSYRARSRRYAYRQAYRK